MSKYGGSEKTTQAFVAAYNKPKLSTRWTQAEVPAGWRRPPLRGDECSPPTAPPWFSGIFRAREWCGVGIAGGQSPLDVTGPWSGPSQGWQHPLPPLVGPTNRALCALWPPSPAQEQHAAVLWCAPACPSFFTFLAANHRDRIRLFKGW